MSRRPDLRTSYDLVADEYVKHIYDELRHKPLDRQLLDRFAARVRGKGPACDMGCGPGQVARYLFDRGVDVAGIDLSTRMLERARELNPGIAFFQGDMRSLGGEDEKWMGITAFYAVIHVPAPQIVGVLKEFYRVLQRDGLLLMSFHIGNETIHLEEWWDHPVNVDFYFFQPSQMVAFLTEAGFHVEDTLERDPYPDVEYPSRRAYVFASKQK